MSERPTNHGCGTPGTAGTVTVTVLVLVLVLVLTVVLVLLLVLVLVLVLGEVVVVVVDSVVLVVGVVVVVVGAVVVVLSVVDEGERVAVVGVVVCEVVVSGVNGLLLLELEPPKINQTINTKRIAARAPNPTSAHGLRYQGIGSSAGGPGGSPGGCWPYALYAVGCVGCSE
jgi:membrane-bound ClpP family serine protease